MSTGIGSFCKRDVVTVSPDASIVEACRLMRHHHIGALVIARETTDGKIPVGILTDRDIAVEVVALGVAPETLKVSEIVQRPVTTAAEGAGYAETVRLMSVNGMRRMPIVDAGGKLVGIITVDDILRQLAGPLVALGDLVVRERNYEMGMRQ